MKLTTDPNCFHALAVNGVEYEMKEKNTTQHAEQYCLGFVGYTKLQCARRVYTNLLRTMKTNRPEIVHEALGKLFLLNRCAVRRAAHNVRATTYRLKQY